MRVVLLPVKDPGNAKRRLASLLSADERRDLVWAMLREMAAELDACREADCVVVVARDPAVIQYAKQQGWEVIPESEQVSQGHSVDRASFLLQKRGAEVVLSVPGDIPLLQARDVDSLLRQPLAGPGAVLVPSRDGKGTNALLRMPPTVFPSRFGKNSFLLHRTAADAAAVALAVVENPRMALDLDEAADLVYIVKWNPGSSTSKMINEMGLLQRLASQRHKIDGTS